MAGGAAQVTDEGLLTCAGAVPSLEALSYL